MTTAASSKHQHHPTPQIIIFLSEKGLEIPPAHTKKISCIGTQKKVATRTHLMQKSQRISVGSSCFLFSQSAQSFRLNTLIKKCGCSTVMGSGFFFCLLTSLFRLLLFRMVGEPYTNLFFFFALVASHAVRSCVGGGSTKERVCVCLQMSSHLRSGADARYSLEHPSFSLTDVE
jgi:hypothetical protein